MNIVGIEIESKISQPHDLLLHVAGTYQDEEDEKVLCPHFTAKVGMGYDSPRGWRVGLFLNHFGEAEKNGGAIVNPEAAAVNLLSLNVSYAPSFLRGLELNAFVQNALDEPYHFPEFSKNWINTLPLEPGRAIYGTISYRF
jgi:outer membrane receptor protein involved in Fe transport